MSKDVILLVEDNPVDEELAVMALKQGAAGLSLAVAHDGVEALDYLLNVCQPEDHNSKDLPKVVFLDLKLPKLNGFDVLRKVRATPSTRYLPVVIFSSSDEEIDIRASYQLGANSYVRKPVDFRQYVERLQQAGMYWSGINQPLNQG